MCYTWTLAQKGGPVLGSMSGVDRTLRGHLDRDGSGVGCLRKSLGTILQVRGLHPLWRGGHSVGFLTGISGCLPHGHAHEHECHWVSLTERQRSAAADVEYEKEQLCCAWAVPLGGLGEEWENSRVLWYIGLPDCGGMCGGVRV